MQNIYITNKLINSFQILIFCHRSNAIQTFTLEVSDSAALRDSLTVYRKLSLEDTFYFLTFMNFALHFLYVKAYELGATNKAFFS